MGCKNDLLSILYIIKKYTMSQVYVVIRKHNHLRPFPPSIVPSPVVTWNAGNIPIEGIFAYYPSQYAYNISYEIYGPYQLQGGIRDFRVGRNPDPSGPQLNYPSFDIDRGFYT
jgi:hypothetical protein